MLTSRLSYRAVMAISVVCFVCGVFALSTLTNDTSRLVLTVFSILTGFGVGFSFSVLSMASVHHFDMRQRGAATSTNSFLRSLGMTLGITIFGIVQRNLLADKMSAAFAGTGQAGGQAEATFGNAQEALSSDKRAMIPPEILDKITDALSGSIAHTFMWALIPAVCSIMVVIAMPKDRIVRGAAARPSKPSKQQG